MFDVSFGEFVKGLLMAILALSIVVIGVGLTASCVLHGVTQDDYLRFITMGVVLLLLARLR